MPDDDFEARIARFEAARRLGDPRAMVVALDGPPALAAAGRLRLLVELACVDLEFGWRAPGGAVPPTLADYVARFPELGTLDDLPIELIGEEYRARRRWGDRPSPEAFLARFRTRGDAIRAELDRVDEEIAAEGEKPRPPDVGPTRPVLSIAEAEAEAGGPLRSSGDYLLRRMIGAGRMGKVYEAMARESGRLVAIKYLRRSLLDHPRVVRRFLGEARTIAGLRHPHLVATEGMGRTAGGSYFLVMELVDGPDLAAVVASRVVAIDEAVRWVIAASGAIEHAHDRGIIHCDLKPGNLLLDGSGRVRVADFGLARSLGDDSPWAAEVEGTAPFMAPEQVDRTLGPIDRRTDVYGLGAVLFTLLTGRPPFPGRRLAEVLARVAADLPVPPPATLRPEIPEPLNELCLRALAKPSDQRFPDVGSLRAALIAIRETRDRREDRGPP